MQPFPDREAVKSYFAGLAPLFFLVAGVALVARLPAGFSGFAVDDYSLYQSADKDVLFVLSQGRWAFAAMIYVLEAIGLNLIGPYFFFVLLAIVAQALFFVVLTALLFPTMPRILQATGGAFVVAHPYWAEVFTFKIVSLSTAIIYLLLAIALIFAARSGNRVFGNWIIPTVLVFVAFSFNQSTINLLLVVIFGALARLTLRSSSEDMSTESAFFLFRRLPIVSLFAGLLYVFAFFMLTVFGFVEPNSRTSLLRLSEAPSRLGELADLVGFILFSGEPVFPAPAKTLFFLVILTSVILWAVTLISRRAWGGALILGTLLLALPLLLAGVIVILTEWWPTPRVLQHQGLLFGLVVLMGLEASRSIKSKRFLSIAASFFVAVGVALNSQVFADQRTMNNLDAQTANRIMMEIETVEGEDRARTLVFRGGFASYQYGLKTTHMDLNISAFGASWAQQAVLEYNTGRKFRGSKESDREIAEEYCSTSPLWPSQGSIAVLDDVAVVCFGR